MLNFEVLKLHCLQFEIIYCCRKSTLLAV